MVYCKECLKKQQGINLDFSLTAETAKTAEMRKIIFLYWEISYTKAPFAHWPYFQKVTQAYYHGQQRSESGVSFYITPASCFRKKAAGATSAFSAVRNAG